MAMPELQTQLEQLRVALEKVLEICAKLAKRLPDFDDA